MSEPSLAEIYLQHKGWKYERTNTGQFKVWECPLCRKDNFHFYMKEVNGLWDCKVCGRTGNLNDLKRAMGDFNMVTGVQSTRDVALEQQAPQPMPDAISAHQRLMEDVEAFEYITKERGISRATVERLKLGMVFERERKWLLIPYFYRGNYIFYKRRTIPPAAKEFQAAAGREVPLYNEDVLDSDGERLIVTEGELDCITLLSHGIEDAVGIPGANIGKLKWLQKFDDSKRKIYLCYDNDKVGQKAAREMARKIGIEKCINVLLPPFQTIDGQPGKDVNEWFRSGRTKEDFEKLLAQSSPFPVENITSLTQALDEEADDMEKNGGLPALSTPWPSLNPLLRGIEWGELVGVIAEGKIGKSTLALNMLDYYWRTMQLPVLFFCMEMPPKRLARKWASMVTETPDTPGVSTITLDTIKQARQVAMDIPKGDFLLGHMRERSAKVLYETIRQVVRIYGVKVVCFDNLQFLITGRNDNIAVETGNITKELKQLATDLNIAIILIIQPNRIKDGEMVGARHAFGSSAIEKDCDTVIALHRDRIGNIYSENFSGVEMTEQTFSNFLRVSVDLSRYAPGGITTLMFMGDISKIRELTPLEKDQFRTEKQTKKRG